MDKFSDFISEQKNEQPYKLIAFYNTGEVRRDIKEPNTMQILELLKKENIINLFNSRLSVYNVANIKIDTNEKDINQIVMEIRKIYGK